MRGRKNQVCCHVVKRSEKKGYLLSGIHGTICVIWGQIKQSASGNTFVFRKKLKVIKIVSNQPILLHFAQLAGHGAAIHRQIIRQLLPGEGNIEGGGLVAVHLLGELGEQLLTRGASGNMLQLAGVIEQLFGHDAHDIAAQLALTVADLGNRGENAVDVDKNDRCRAERHHADGGNVIRQQ